MANSINIVSEDSNEYIATNIYVGTAWHILSEDKSSVLIDVRTELEWNINGYPDLSSLGKTVQKISWRVNPSMDYNKNFIEELKEFVKDYDTPILFICKAGTRSSEAALLCASKGYKNCYNIINGFEGASNPHEEYNKGWKEQQLPWKRS